LQFFSADGLNPTIEPSKFFSFDFKGKFARFKAGDIPATIDNDRSIFLLHRSRSAFHAYTRKTVSAYSTPRSHSPCSFSFRQKRSACAIDGEWLEG
jgi:hypothetical protein